MRCEFEPARSFNAIKVKCLDCSGGSRAEVKQCLVTACALYPFRLGKNPWRREVSQATREMRRRNAAKIAQRVNTAE
jgi:hypothetical protein